MNDCYFFILKKRKTKPKKPKTKTKKKISGKNDDIYSIYSQSVDKFFSEIQKATAIYLQASTDIQQELIQSWKKNMDTAISFQKKFSAKSETKMQLSKESLRLIDDLTRQTMKAQELQNQMFSASVDAIIKNIRTCKESEQLFSKINEQLIQTCLDASLAPTMDPKIVKNTVLEFQKIIGRNYLGTNPKKP